MPIYKYKAITENGQIIKSKINCESEDECIKILKRNELVIVDVQKIKKKSFINYPCNLDSYEKHLFINKISTKEIIAFTQSLYLLKKSNFTNLQAFETIISNTSNVGFCSILKDILCGIEHGKYIYETLEYYSEIFPFVYTNIIKVGEISGDLENSLKQALQYMEKNDQMNNNLRKILIPNILLFVGTLVALIICVIIGVPVIQDLFDSVGSKDELPFITLWFYNLINTITANWKIIILYVFTVIFILSIISITKYGKKLRNKFQYNMPIFGKLNYEIDFARVMKCFLVNMQNDCKIQDALEISKNVVKNEIMLNVIDEAIENLYVGKSWVEPFEKMKYSNKISMEMLKIGMQTNLKEMTEKIIEYLDFSINENLKKITKILPEVAYSFVGVILIFFVIVVLVPCIQVYMGGFLFSAYDL